MIAWRRYLGDPLCWGAITLYTVNRLWLKPALGHGNALLHGHLNDALLIPAALPPLLFAYRCLGLRMHDRPPSWPEIALHWAAGSLFFEWIGPGWWHRGTGDPWDAVSYAAGALLAGLLWQRAAPGTEARG